MRTEKQLNNVAENLKAQAVEFSKKTTTTHRDMLLAEWAFMVGAAAGVKATNDQMDFFNESLKAGAK